MKKFWKIVSILLLGALLMSCGKPSPSDQVAKDIEAFKRISLEDLLSEMGTGEGEMLFSYMVSNDQYARALFNKVMDFDYEIEGETVSADGNYAEVTVTIRTYPFGRTVAESMAQLTVEAFFGVFDLREAVVEKFLDLDEKSYSQTIVIHCTKTNDGWKTDLMSNEDFVDAFTGGFISGVKALEGFVDDLSSGAWGSDDYDDYDDDDYDEYSVPVTSVDSGTAGSSIGMSLEEYLMANPQVAWDLESTFSGDEYYGEVATDGNKIIFLVDLSAMVGSEYEDNDEFRSMIGEAYDTTFEDSESEIYGLLGEIESATGLSGVSMEVLVIYEGNEIYSRSFNAS